MKPVYETPLAARYASGEMLHLFSPDCRYETWRKLWVELARAQQQLGLPITTEQVKELEEHIAPINYDVVAAREKEVRHDVMAHIYGFGEMAPGARGVIHLGATSCYVTDNADLILYRDALRYLRGELCRAIDLLCGLLAAVGVVVLVNPSPSTDRIPSRTAGGPFRPGDGSSAWSHALRVTSTGSTFTPCRFASSISVPGA